MFPIQIEAFVLCFVKERNIIDVNKHPNILIDSKGS